jgi:copper oxidase (laccase) domain-containing protein
MSRTGYEIQDEFFNTSINSESVLLQANRRAGTIVDGYGTGWELNRQRALNQLGKYAISDRVVRMKPPKEAGKWYVDLGTESACTNLYGTEALITTGNEVLHANHADCGEIAVSGYNESGLLVRALVHAGRKVVGQGGHMQAFEYMKERHKIKPEELWIRMSPSAREGYALDYMDYRDDEDEAAWNPYVKGVLWFGQAMYQVDVHRRTVDDLTNFGIKPDHMIISDVDTTDSPEYFSNFQFNHEFQMLRGLNGLFFARSKGLGVQPVTEFIAA